ncbi:MAG: Ni/Fe-hydrogenase cytochrome b subunit [candidate division Zixibacteria bacterium HGW-Zixibacteria-1]|nr:MAG: Ni/Fe-hydrogenase cytochrome b subunit [candidate division Zixibacteria bacterium HGW-Zixibacteria-1]
MNRVQNLKLVLWMIIGLAAAVGVTRFIFGLGATTNLTDATPWGLWIGFDVMAGVALAAGGFVITALFYIMRREEFHSFVKPAVLTAFLGYVAVIVGLLFDLGLPWNIWHMIIFWNPHSPLFEVGWCVMLYTTVLLLEFSPVPLEEASRYARIRTFLLKFRFPLILLGIMLSTLHQSSLGSLFLIMPYKLYPLWYSNIMPIQFFISAVALGLMMVAFESLFSHWLYRRKTETQNIAKLGKIAVWVLLIYLAVKLIDIIISGEFSLIFSGTWEANLFIVEILISTIIPIVIFSFRNLRDKSEWQWVGAVSVVFGMVFNRINVGGLTMLRATGDVYIPSWMEVSISLGVVSAAVLAFLFAIEKFHVWEDRPKHPETDQYALPQFDRASEVWLGPSSAAARTKYSLAFIICFAIAFAFIPEQKIRSEGIEQVLVQRSRGGDKIFIDGNRDDYGVLFDHARHVKDNGKENSCLLCHHMNMPLDSNSGCWECHRDMYSRTDVFDHDWHASASGGRLRCNDCHSSGVQRNGEAVKKCEDCHADLILQNSPIVVKSLEAVSYTDAMHDLCVTCHRKKAVEIADKKDLALCSTCHQSAPPDYLQRLLKFKNPGPSYNHVVLPGLEKVQPEKVQ